MKALIEWMAVFCIVGTIVAAGLAMMEMDK